MKLRSLILFCFAAPAALLAGPGFCYLDGAVTGAGVTGRGGGGGGGAVDSVVAGTNVSVDATDPANPIISTDGLTLTENRVFTFTGPHTFVNRVDFDNSALYWKDFTSGSFTASLVYPSISVTSNPVLMTLPDKSGTLALISDLGTTSPWEAEGGLGSIAFVNRGTGYINASAEYTYTWGRFVYSNSPNNHNLLVGGGPSVASAAYLNTGGPLNVVMFPHGGGKAYSALDANNVIVGTGVRLFNAGSGRLYNTLYSRDSIVNLSGASYNTILGGLQGQAASSDQYTTLFAGSGLQSVGADYVFSAGTDNDSTDTAANYGAMLSGSSNEADIYGTVLGGRTCEVDGPQYGTVLGGYLSRVTANYGLALGYNADPTHVGAFVLADGNSTSVASGGADSITFSYAGGIDIVPVTTAPASPADDRITLFAFDNGAGEYSFRAKFTDGTVNTITSHTP